MSSATKIDDCTYIVVRRPTLTDDLPNALYCITAYQSKDLVQILVFDLFARPAHTDSPLNLVAHELEIRSELFNTTLWAKDVGAVVDKCAEIMLEAHAAMFPVELAYEFGGLVCNKVPKLYLDPTEIH